ncbi:MAG: DNA polymerase [Dehalococcoidia bacterium]|jgi:uracil-DNA glycosylase family 4|nr:DNA polymerase [Dehalococcoidia bacterium]
MSADIIQLSPPEDQPAAPAGPAFWEVPGDPQCSACPLADKRGKVCVQGYFPMQGFSGLCFVGEQPWTEEAKAGRPFVGASGRLLWAICKTLGIPQETTLILNAISCYGGEWPASSTAEKAAKAEARTACRPMLLRALEAWKPRVIVALGGEAIRSLLNDESATVGGYRGTVNRFCGVATEVHPDDPDGFQPWAAWLVGAEHPAAILRSEGGFTAPVLKKDLAKAWRWLQEGAPRAWPSPVEACPSVERTAELCARWRAAGRVTGDVETVPEGKPGRWRDPLRLLGLGDEDLTAWWPFKDGEWQQHYGERSWLECRALLRDLLAAERVVKEFHNKQYDMAVLESHGFPVRGVVEDTMVMHHVLHLRGVAHDLGYVAAEYLDLPAWKKEFKKEWQAPLEVLGTYNGNDVLATARVRPRLEADLRTRGLWATYEMDRDGTDVALAMSRNGIGIDRHRWQQYVDKYAGEAAELEAQVYELTGAAARQVETLEYIDQAGVLQWANVKVGDIEKALASGDAPLPNIPVLADICDLVAGRLLQPKLVDDIAESAAKLREVLEPAACGWAPWMPLDPAGPVDLKPFQKEAKSKGVAVTALTSPEARAALAARDQNAAARQAAGRACAVIRSALGRLQKAVMQPLLNLESGQQMGIVIHSPKWLGLPVNVPGENGYLTNEEALYHLSWHPMIRAWQAWGSAAYRRDWLLHTLPIGPDGRAHGSFKTTRTPNARWAGGSEGEEKWNPQNPEKDTIDIFAAPPGRRLVGRDFSMIEIRVAAALSQDKRMVAQINDFDEGRTQWDIHQQRAIRCWPEFTQLDPKVQKKKRNLAKRANFGPIYGASKYMLLPVMLSQIEKNRLPQALSDYKRMSDELLAESQRILDDIHADWAELFLWLEEGYRRAMRNGILRNGYVTGREIHFPLRDKDHIDRRFCFNAPVQCTARELVMAAMLRINKQKSPDALWVMDAHDQLLLECAENEADDHNALMEREMGGMFNGVRILSDGGSAGGVARTWKELK